MQWRDEGILLRVRRHGESNAIIETLTAEHGRHSGLVRGGASKKLSATLQPGAQLMLEWNGRLAEHLGTFKVDLIRARTAQLITDRDRLAASNVVSALIVDFLPEREHDETIYAETLKLMDDLGNSERYWPVSYALWEFALLGALGFGLDFSRCAATGSTSDLVYVSPRSGRSVSREAGAPFADRLLPLPAFLKGGREPAMPDVRQALRLTGFFLKNWVCPAFETKDLPASRVRLLRLLEDYEFEEQEHEEDYTDDEREWLRKWEEKHGERSGCTSLSQTDS
jgi:DNA repair protein RecO (recombination protein O)